MISAKESPSVNKPNYTSYLLVLSFVNYPVLNLLVMKTVCAAA